jgi:uncharacterized protein YaiI (UPF0178 family)
MRLYIDADACPVVIREIVFKAAERTGVELTLVANRHVRIPSLSTIHFIKVAAGPDVADDEIVNRLKAGDLVITGDIPLAAKALEKGGFALSPRGEMFSADSIRSRLSVRDFMDSLRASGVDTGGPAALNKSDRQNFANQLDRFLTIHMQTTS